MVYSHVPIPLDSKFPTESNGKPKDRANVAADNGLITLILKVYYFYALLLSVTHHDKSPKSQL